MPDPVRPVAPREDELPLIAKWRAEASYTINRGFAIALIKCARELESRAAAPVPCAASPADPLLNEEKMSEIRVVYPGGITAREHAILAAHDWQVEHKLENMPTPSAVYLVVRDLLSLVPTAELQACLLKHRHAPPVASGAGGGAVYWEAGADWRQP